MSKAEEAALKAFPRDKFANDFGKRIIFNDMRDGFIIGYEQAEKDLALTWQDIRRIVKIADDLLDDPEARVEFKNHNEEYYYKRVLGKYEADSED